MAASLVMSIGRLPSLIAAFLLCVGETTFAWGQFLAPDKWKSYGAVYRLTMPGHLGATTKWTDGPTTIEFTIRGADISIAQDGKQLAAITLTGPLAERLRTMSRLKHVTWADGIYGRFLGTAIEGALMPPR